MPAKLWGVLHRARCEPWAQVSTCMLGAAASGWGASAVVVLTANHYWVDAIAAVAIVTVAWLFTSTAGNAM